ncbi:MAG: family 16 glycosylhydrolase [Ferruginibacter sp.]
MKNYIQSLITAALLFFILMSCKKAGSAETIIAPSNLVVNSKISTDGRGAVAFTATATNAVSYDYEFGNGEIKTVPTGVVNYTYAVAGTNTFTVTVTAKSSDGLTLKKSLTITVTVTLPVPTLFWSEEFNTDGAPDPTKWGYDLGAGGWGNNELEYYTNRPENAIVQGGVLKINAIKENHNGSPYTSARLLSKGKFEFKYGTVEIKAKLPAGVGTWPAIWMLGSDNGTAGWPACGEIDIMEHLGRTLNTIYGTLHYPGRSGGNADGGTTVIDNATTEFHIYKVEWTAAAIKIYVDDQLFHTVANSTSMPFNHDFFLILNIAMGGGFGGPVDPAVTTATMEIDYIRVYK